MLHVWNNFKPTFSNGKPQIYMSIYKDRMLIASLEFLGSKAAVATTRTFNTSMINGLLNFLIQNNICYKRLNRWLNSMRRAMRVLPDSIQKMV
jgi:hypothetical protein